MEICVAHPRVSIPQPVIPVLNRLLTGIQDPFIAEALVDFIPLFCIHLRKIDNLFIVDLCGGPSMRQDCVRRRFVITELEDLGSTVHSFLLVRHLLPLEKCLRRMLLVPCASVLDHRRCLTDDIHISTRIGNDQNQMKVLVCMVQAHVVMELCWLLR